MFSKGRLEAFSDGVLAIVITIMVLEMSAPSGNSWSDLSEQMPKFVAYIVSYVYIGVYWINHHILINSAEKVDRRVTITNLMWMFWLSLIPFATSWISSAGFGDAPGVLYSVILFMASLNYLLLNRAVNMANGNSEGFIKSITGDKRGIISLVGHAVAIPIAYFLPAIAYVIYVSLAVLWNFKRIGKVRRLENSSEHIEK